MLKHNLKIAFRNLWKYKMQTVISIIGLAVGFTCFSLATLWMRYEMTYDSFHKNLYVVVAEGKNTFDNRTFGVSHLLSAYLKETFPEVKDAISISEEQLRKKSTCKIEDQESKLYNQEIELYCIFTTSAFMRMFDVKILEGKLDFPDYTNREIAITQEKAQTLFGKESPVGKTLTINRVKYAITAVVSNSSKHSNLPFDVLGVANRFMLRSDDPKEVENYEWGANYSTSILELHTNVDVEAFKQKLNKHEINKGWHKYTNFSAVALTDIRTEDPTMMREIKFQHIKFFAWMGILVIICSLFNYLTLFVSRFKIRGKELALRIVCGASLWSLFSLLLIEFLITLLVASLFGLIILNIVSPAFQKLSEIQMNVGSIYVELSLYISAIILLTILLFAFTLAIFRKYALNISIRRTNNQLFRKISIVVQLIISIGFVFCTAVMIKQVHYLHNNEDIGFEYKNRSCLYIAVSRVNLDVIHNKLKQIPEITDIIADCGRLIPAQNWMTSVSRWDGKTGDESIRMGSVDISEAFAEFYGLQLITGEMLSEEDNLPMSEAFSLGQNVLINESAMKFFGWNKDNAVGKHFAHNNRVKGVIKNIYNGAPTVEVPPMYYSYRYKDEKEFTGVFLFKYKDRKIAEAKVREVLKSESLEGRGDFANVFDAEETYESFFTSEKALITILNFMSAICVLISVFGFFSLVSLSCEEKRKEIAIRKVNGADVHDIIAIFFKEYSLLLAIGAAIAFPIGYYIMKGWIEQYMNQSTIDAWIYAAILLLISSVIILCVGWRVYKTSRENPADVVKSE